MSLPSQQSEGWQMEAMREARALGGFQSLDEMRGAVTWSVGEIEQLREMYEISHRGRLDALAEVERLRAALHRQVAGRDAEAGAPRFSRFRTAELQQMYAALHHGRALISLGDGNLISTLADECAEALTAALTGTQPSDEGESAA